MAFSKLFHTSTGVRAAKKSSVNRPTFRNLVSLLHGRDAKPKARKMQWTPPTPPRVRRTAPVVVARTRNVERLVFPKPMPVVVEEFTTEPRYPRGWALIDEY